MACGRRHDIYYMEKRNLNVSDSSQTVASLSGLDWDSEKKNEKGLEVDFLRSLCYNTFLSNDSRHPKQPRQSNESRIYGT